MNRDEITRKTSELSTPDTPAISLLKTVIRRKKKWHFSRATLPFRLAKRKSLSNAWEKSAGSPAERPLPLQRRNSIRIPKSVVPEKLRTLDRGRPWRDSQFASTRLSPSRDMSR